MLTKQELVIKDKVNDIAKYLINNFSPTISPFSDKNIYAKGFKLKISTQFLRPGYANAVLYKQGKIRLNPICNFYVSDNQISSSLVGTYTETLLDIFEDILLVTASIGGPMTEIVNYLGKDRTAEVVKPFNEIKLSISPLKGTFWKEGQWGSVSLNDSDEPFFSLMFDCGVWDGCWRNSPIHDINHTSGLVMEIYNEIFRKPRQEQ